MVSAGARMEPQWREKPLPNPSQRYNDIMKGQKFALQMVLVSGIYDAFDLLKRVLVPSSNILLGTYKSLNHRILLQEAGLLVTINSTMRLHCRHPQWSSCRVKQGLSSGRHAPIITEMSESPGLLLLSRSQR
ncbi:hypothetical protein PoB_004821100 [Plakobranchus ocellatus]|uniref:Uncharacterized protein n=1 Tax=Plakobranchus ocellatus TaxID=259542 RepID=A0AAV4BRL6_9GAST|nr:hypothetical protein PoB_004821100 [Plakobranchus ocellatus]